ncbi:MAG: serine hydrolase [Thermosynechococcaceae cyanobacterium]
MTLRILSVSILSLLLTAVSAKANTLTTWKFDTQGDRLSFVADDEVRPIAKVISNPTRLIVDLPGVRLGHPKVTKPLDGKYSALRVGQFSPSMTRLVVELDPEYGVDPSRIKIQAASRRSWSVALPEPNRGDRLSGKSEVAIAVPNVPPEFIQSGTFGGVLRAGKELQWLQQRLAAVHASYPVVSPSVFVVDLATGDYADVGGGKAFPAASTIKLPILIAFFQDLDAGKVSLSEKLVMRPELIASGSGYMQDLPAWSSYSALYTVGKMIETSDNTATNMIIKRLGGPWVLNKRFRSWGLQDTVIRNWLPDLSGTNMVSAQDHALILTKLAKGNLLSDSSRAKAIAILKTCHTRSLLVPGIGPGAQIAHKTGDIGFAIGDAGIVFMPNGRQYIVSVMARRPYDDPRGRDYIQTISRITYAYFSQR